MYNLRNITSLFQEQEQHLGQFLDKQDVSKLIAIKNELNDTWRKKQIFRTETEMRVSVLNDAHFPTPAAKYWQCVREQNVFFENIISLSFEYRKNLVEIKKLERKLEDELDELEQELITIALEEKQYARANMELVAKDRVRELELWSKLKAELDDGSFDTDNVNNHQMASLQQTLETRASLLTPTTNPTEIANVLGPLATLNRLNTREAR